MSYEGVGPRKWKDREDKREELCRIYQKKGFCHRHPCPYKHLWIDKEIPKRMNADEEPPEVCNFFEKNGWCSKNPCRYIHNEPEIDPYKAMHMPPEELNKVHVKPKKKKKDRGLPSESVIARAQAIKRGASSEDSEATSSKQQKSDPKQILRETAKFFSR